MHSSCNSNLMRDIQYIFLKFSYLLCIVSMISSIEFLKFLLKYYYIFKDVCVFGIGVIMINENMIHSFKYHLLYASITMLHSTLVIIMLR